jgi:phospholipid:diacylglycerol acyltransferase
MSSLRKRILGGTPSPSPTPRESTPEKAEEVRLAPVSKIIDSKKHKHGTRKRRGGLIFFLGGLFGIVVAGFFAKQSDLIEFPEFGDLSMDSLMDVLPAGFVRDARDLAVSFLSWDCGEGWGRRGIELC